MPFLQEKKICRILPVSFVILVLLCALPAQANDQQLLLATTTSTANTGLLEYLAPMFTRTSGIELKWVATGTGKALKLGANCDADVLMVHAPSAEKAFINGGFGIKRRPIMFNDFVLIGPESDPAAINMLKICPALVTIAEKKIPFASRGDNSGTNKKEIALWKSCTQNVPEEQKWYLQTGQGMLATINVAAERGGYTMTDRGTYIRYETNYNGNPSLAILVEGDNNLINQYSVIEVNPERCPKAKNDLARRFGDWLTGSEGQQAIGRFRLMNKQLFTPNASKSKYLPAEPVAL